MGKGMQTKWIYVLREVRKELYLLKVIQIDWKIVKICEHCFHSLSNLFQTEISVISTLPVTIWSLCFSRARAGNPYLLFTSSGLLGATFTLVQPVHPMSHVRSKHLDHTTLQTSDWCPWSLQKHLTRRSRFWFADFGTRSDVYLHLNGEKDQMILGLQLYTSTSLFSLSLSSAVPNACRSLLSPRLQQSPSKMVQKDFLFDLLSFQGAEFLLGMDLFKNLKPLPHFFNPGHWFLRLGLRIKGTHGRSLLHHISWGRKKPRYTRWATEMTEMTLMTGLGLLTPATPQQLAPQHENQERKLHASKPGQHALKVRGILKQDSVSGWIWLYYHSWLEVKVPHSATWY